MTSLEKLKSRMVSGSVWAIAGEIIAGGARALAYIVYAKLLSPADFGVVAFSLLLVGIFPLVIDNSIGLALMRHSEDEANIYNTAFVLNIALAIVAVLGLTLAGPFAAKFIHERSAAYVLPILSIQLVVNAFASVRISSARRRFQYKRLARVRIISSASSIALGLPLAYMGFGYWALVVSSIGGALGQTVAAVCILDWRPRFKFDRASAMTIAGFTSWTSLDMFITWLVMSGGGLFLAFFLGAHALGLVRLSDQIDTYFIGTALNPLIPVLYASFCESANQRDPSWRVFERSTKRLTPLAFGAAGVVIVAAWPVGSMLGSKWNGIGEVIALNAIADGISYSLLGVASYLRAHSLPKAVTLLRVATVIVQITVYAGVARMGVYDFLFGKIGIEAFVYVSSLFLLWIIFGKPVSKILRSQVIQGAAIALITIIAVLVASTVESAGAVEALFAGVTSFALLFGVFIALTQRDVFSLVFAKKI